MGQKFLGYSSGDTTVGSVETEKVGKIVKTISGVDVVIVQAMFETLDARLCLRRLRSSAVV